MPIEGVSMVEEPVLCGSPLGSSPTSPKSRIKFLCSQGGKILPQPADGHLKYVGGETRVISVPRDIKLSELMKKLTPQIEGDMVLKYQLVHEELDVLISVKTDEDLRHMLDEYDRSESAGIPRLRAFLFPAKPVVVDHHTTPPEPLEQRYIDAINGIIRAREAGIRIQQPISISQASFGFSSACSSPRSPDSCTTDGVIHESLLQSIFQNRSQLHKVQSSPSFYNVSNQQQHGLHHNLQQQHHYYNHRQQYYNGYQLNKPPHGPGDPVKGPDRLFSVRSVGRTEGLRYQMDHNQHYYQSPSRHSRGGGCCIKCMHFDDCERRNGSISPSSYSMEIGNGCASPGGYSVERRTSSLSPSPIPLSPRFSNMAGLGRPAASATAPPKGLGMQLGKTQKTNQFLESLKAEGEVIVEDVRPSVGQAKPAAAPLTDPVTLTVEEKINVTLKRDGGVSNFVVQGTLSLQILNQEDAFIQVQIETSGNPAILFKAHPNMNKELFANENILGLKDPNRPFPTGQGGDGVSLLRWRMQSTDESILPLTINCWPSVSGSETYVNIEYETPAQIDLQNVVISVPLPALREAPNVQQIDGEWRYDSRNSVLEWSVLLIDNSNRSGALEFVVPAADPSAFFPISAQFTSSRTFSDVKVVNVLPLKGGATPKHAQRTLLATETYQVV